MSEEKPKAGEATSDPSMWDKVDPWLTRTAKILAVLTAVVVFISTAVVPYYMAWVVAFAFLMGPGIHYYWWFYSRSIFRPWWISHMHFVFAVWFLVTGYWILNKNNSTNTDVVVGCSWILLAGLYYGLCMLASYEQRMRWKLFLCRLTTHGIAQNKLAIRTINYLTAIAENTAKQVEVDSNDIHPAVEVVQDLVTEMKSVYEAADKLNLDEV